MSVQELQKYTYVSKYAKHNRKARRRETWEESVTRVKEMHLRKYPQAAAEIEWAFDFVYQQKVLGSQRVLQFGGEPVERHNARAYNCTATYCDRLRMFQEAFYLLLCGCGVGYSVQKHHVANLPPFSEARRQGRSLPRKTFVVPDSIEGWSDAAGVLLSSYFDLPIFPEYQDCEVVFDYSLVRKAGSPISSGTGKAPGPEPLKKALEHVRVLLDRVLADGCDRLRPIHAYDIICFLSDAVLSGGVRRSATICVFSLDDDEMMNAKTGDWFYTNPQRARSNNSVLLLRGQVSHEDFMAIMSKVRQFGEPGFLWADSTEYIVNPCVEVGFWPVHWIKRLTGWQMCNLCTINGKRIRSRQEFVHASIAAAIIGTLQAGYTDFPYLGEISEEIVRRESLLGVSITGMMDSPDILFDPEMQAECARLIAYTNKQIAALLGINPAARCTALKPEGTTSCLLGCSSGAHLNHSRRFLRRCQANRMEAPFRLFEQVNPQAVEDSVWSANKTDGVITFCCEAPEGAKTKADMGAVDFMKHVKLTQENWIHYGRDPELCTQPWLTNNVSNTINVRPDEWDEVAEYIYQNSESFAGVSLLPHTGDLDYNQAPFCAVHTVEEIEDRYGVEAANSYLARQLVEQVTSVGDELWPACDMALGYKAAEGAGQQMWVERVRSLAEQYFGGDVKQATYLLKELRLLDLWNALKDSYVPVDYTELVEDEDGTNFTAESACVNGKCEVQYDLPELHSVR